MCTCLVVVNRRIADLRVAATRTRTFASFLAENPSPEDEANALEQVRIDIRRHGCHDYCADRGA
jgi:hypothetical protein